MDLREKMLTSTQYVVDNAKHVSIKFPSDQVLKEIASSVPPRWDGEMPIKIPDLGVENNLRFRLIMHSIIFSFWGENKWYVEIDNKRYTSTYAIVACMVDALDKDVPLLSADYLANLSVQEGRKLFPNSELLPLFEKRIAILNEVGTKLNEIDGDLLAFATGTTDIFEFVNNLANSIPSFRDSVIYEGKEIFFYKRAQLVALDFNFILDNHYTNAESLLPLSDYKVPMVLEDLGVLNYSKELKEKIVSQEELMHGSEEEIEIRACEFQAVLMLTKKIYELGYSLRCSQVDSALWLMGKNKEKYPGPYHRTRTIAY